MPEGPACWHNGTTRFAAALTRRLEFFLKPPCTVSAPQRRSSEASSCASCADRRTACSKVTRNPTLSKDGREGTSSGTPLVLHSFHSTRARAIRFAAALTRRLEFFLKPPSTVSAPQSRSSQVSSCTSCAARTIARSKVDQKRKLSLKRLEPNGRRSAKARAEQSMREKVCARRVEGMPLSC